MPSKRKKTKKKQTKSKTAPAKRAKKTLRKKQAKPSKNAITKKQSSNVTSSRGSLRERKRPMRPAQQLESSRGEGTVSARQSADLEGLSRVAEADSESVDELVEEGNVFEAGAVAGVEEADDQDTREVHTHEVPEDDVPGEYLDKD
jgi:hypothetical protein